MIQLDTIFNIWSHGMALSHLITQSLHNYHKPQNHTAAIHYIYKYMHVHIILMNTTLGKSKKKKKKKTAHSREITIVLPKTN